MTPQLQAPKTSGFTGEGVLIICIEWEMDTSVSSILYGLQYIDKVEPMK